MSKAATQQTRAAVTDPWWGDLFALYLGGGLIVGWIAAVGTFLAVYVFAIGSAGLLGILLGWFPAGIAAFIVGWLAGALWPVLAIALAVIIFKVM